MKMLVFLILLLASFSLCTSSNQNASQQSTREDAVFSCLKMCKDNSKNLDYKNGPCLSDNNADWDMNDWVCDIAHSPRQPIDDLPENQCQTFRSGQAHHFVEVDTGCNLIKVI